MLKLQVLQLDAAHIRNFKINSVKHQVSGKIRVPQDTIKKSSFATVKQATNKKQLKTLLMNTKPICYFLGYP